MSDGVKMFLKTPRGKAVLKLSIYVIFFLIFFVMYKATPVRTKPTNTVKSPLEVYSSMTNYQYQYKYNDFMYEGKVYRNKMYFAFNDKEYKVDDSIYAKNDLGEYELTELNKIYYYNNADIASYIDKGTIVGKSEDYENSVTATRYYVEDSLYVTTYIKNDEVFKVSLEVGNDTIEIEYSLVNQVLNPEV